MQVTVDPRVDNEELDPAYGYPLVETVPAEYMTKSPYSLNIREGSENIDASIVGNTPCKPGLDASATKDKQLRFLQ